jgi:hypothetical protein
LVETASPYFIEYLPTGESGGGIHVLGSSLQKQILRQEWWDPAQPGIQFPTAEPQPGESNLENT